MENKESEFLYSEPIREIMGSPPGRILRWGTLAIFTVVLLFLLLSWLIKYPEKIIAPVEITTVNPPVTLVSKISGKIKYLNVNDRETISAGSIAAVMETTAAPDQVLLLEKSTDSINDLVNLPPGSLNEFTQLGEIQGFYSLFRKKLVDLNNFRLNDFYGNKISSLSVEIKKLREYIDRLDAKEKLYIENSVIEEKKFSRDSGLYSNNAISMNDLERSRQSLIRMNIDLEQVRLDQSQKSIELSEKQQLLSEYKIKRADEEGKYYSEVEEAFLNLKAQLKIWKNNYLLISPVGGRVSFTRFWHSDQSVMKDDAVLTIIPDEAGDTIGRIELKMDRSGKVRDGQIVFIKLSGYPYMEYGMLKGKVISRALIPSNDTYMIMVSLPGGLKTFYGRKLEFSHNMQGTAEIITDDIRLLQKVFNPFRYLISRNKRQ